ncbi:MAG: hypothetical protein ACK55I_40380, partial [bacterium]
DKSSLIARQPRTVCRPCQKPVPIAVHKEHLRQVCCSASPRRQSCGFVSAVTRYRMGEEDRIGNIKPINPPS